MTRGITNWPMLGTDASEITEEVPRFREVT
jgi:hypothetical protein